MSALAACAPGAISSPVGDDTLRTALFRDELIGDQHRVDVVLSTGIFDCELPESDDPQELVEELANLSAGACREGTHHLVLSLFKDRGPEWEGRYGFQAPSDEEWEPRSAMGVYFGVLEAEATTSFGLEPVYQPTEIDVYNTLWTGDPGDVRLLRYDDVITGNFQLDGIHLSGRFRATECDLDSRLLDLLVVNPFGVCNNPFVE